MQRRVFLRMSALALLATQCASPVELLNGPAVVFVYTDN